MKKNFDVLVIDLSPSEEKVRRARSVFSNADVSILKAIDWRGKSVQAGSQAILSPLWRGALRSGEHGCALSHLAAWRDLCTSTSYGSRLILEEDWAVTQHFNQATIDMLAIYLASDEPRLVYLGWNTATQSFSKGMRIYWALMAVVKSITGAITPRFSVLYKNIMEKGNFKGSKFEVKFGRQKLTLQSSGLPHGTFGYMLNSAAAGVLVHLNEHCNYRSDEVLNLAELYDFIVVSRTQDPLIGCDERHVSTIQNAV
jgi:GR25 family glycosyltransferase involved in LPS biosynthesis